MTLLADRIRMVAIAKFSVLFVLAIGWTCTAWPSGAALADDPAKNTPALDDPAAKPKTEGASESGDNAKPAEARESSGDSPVDAGDSETPGLSRVTKDYDLWIDKTRKLVVIDGKVVLREGALEMFACSKGTKEHESIVAVNAPARYIHAALLAIGAIPGKPVQFNPEYAPASGPVVEVWILWKDEEGNKHKVRAQEWIKDSKSGKQMPHDFVFGGSSFWRDEESGEVFYQADSGDLVCVSNFTTAMLDIPVPSSQANTGLLFAAFTERIPPRGTPIRLVLIPKLKDAGKGADADAGKDAGDNSTKDAGKGAEKDTGDEATGR